MWALEHPALYRLMFSGALATIGAYGLLRIGAGMLPRELALSARVLVILGVASIIYGGLQSISRHEPSAVIAYSSIGHVGFALVGLSSGTQVGVEGVAIYMAIYVAMTVGLFACILSLRTEAGFVENIDDLRGAAQTRPFVAAIMAVIMFSLIGMPPLAGFFAKWHVFLAAIEANLYVLSVIGVLASAVSAFYYLRVVKTMYFDDPAPAFAPIESKVEGGLIAIAAVFVSPAGYLLIPVLGAWTMAAARALF
jgi:NADH-quinone oxidoreductase subunit N